ncbi:hypothetical protein HBB16_10600 [Pseudonocardia sp. MCCB 268]|nr:hypothetical protein [Pseudonocardia cytotoxica]
MSGREIRELMEIGRCSRSTPPPRTIEAGTAPVAQMRALLDEAARSRRPATRQCRRGDRVRRPRRPVPPGADRRRGRQRHDLPQLRGAAVRQRRVGSRHCSARPIGSSPCAAKHERIVDGAAGGDVERAGKAIDAHLDCPCRCCSGRPDPTAGGREQTGSVRRARSSGRPASEQPGHLGVAEIVELAEPSGGR